MAATAPQTAAPQTQSQRGQTPQPQGAQGQAQSGQNDALTQSVKGMNYDQGRQAVKPMTMDTPTTPAERQMVLDDVRGGETDENKLTDHVFEDRHQQSIQCEPGSPEEAEWLSIRDKLVRPVLTANKAQAKSAAGDAGKPNANAAPADPAGGDAATPATAPATPAADPAADAKAAADKAALIKNGVKSTGTYDYKPDGHDIRQVVRAGSASEMSNNKLKSPAVLNDPSKLGTPLQFPEGTPPPAGATVSKGAARVAGGAPLNVLDFDSTTKYAKVDMLGGQYWIETSKIKFGTAKLQPPFEAAGMRTAGDGANKVAIFNLEGRQVFVSCDKGIQPFDLTYASAIPGQTDPTSAYKNGKDSAAAAHAYNDKNNPGALKDSKALAAANLIASAKGNTYGEDGKPDGGKVDDLCVTIATKKVSDKLTLQQVATFGGKRVWLATSNVKTKGSDWSRFSLEKKSGGLTFVKSRNPDIVGKEQTDYPITAETAALIQSQQKAGLDAVVAGMAKTPKQEELVKKADAFAANPALGKGLRTLGVPASAMSEDGETLNMDLVDRLSKFYQFCQYAQIVTGDAARVVSGIRGRVTAHKMSVAWMLNPQSKGLEGDAKQLGFANDIVAINGVDPSGSETWATPAQVAAFQGALGKLNDEATKAEGMATIQATIEEIRTAKGKIVDGNGKEHYRQGAQAIEGFPTSNKEARRPNQANYSVSKHCGGEAIDITFPYVMNYFDPIIDACALKFGLYRPVKASGSSPEHWHYERIGGSAPKE